MVTADAGIESQKIKLFFELKQNCGRDFINPNLAMLAYQARKTDS